MYVWCMYVCMSCNVCCNLVFLVEADECDESWHEAQGGKLARTVLSRTDKNRVIFEHFGFSFINF